MQSAKVPSLGAAIPSIDWHPAALPAAGGASGEGGLEGLLSPLLLLEARLPAIVPQLLLGPLPDDDRLGMLSAGPRDRLAPFLAISVLLHLTATGVLWSQMFVGVPPASIAEIPIQLVNEVLPPAHLDFSKLHQAVEMTASAAAEPVDTTRSAALVVDEAIAAKVAETVPATPMDAFRHPGVAADPVGVTGAADLIADENAVPTTSQRVAAATPAEQVPMPATEVAWPVDQTLAPAVLAPDVSMDSVDAFRHPSAAADPVGVTGAAAMIADESVVPTASEPVAAATPAVQVPAPATEVVRPVDQDLAPIVSAPDVSTEPVDAFRHPGAAADPVGVTRSADMIADEGAVPTASQPVAAETPAVQVPMPVTEVVRPVDQDLAPIVSAADVSMEPVGALHHPRPSPADSGNPDSADAFAATRVRDTAAPVVEAKPFGRVDYSTAVAATDARALPSKDLAASLAGDPTQVKNDPAAQLPSAEIDRGAVKAALEGASAPTLPDDTTASTVTKDASPRTAATRSASKNERFSAAQPVESDEIGFSASRMYATALSEHMRQFGSLSGSAEDDKSTAVAVYVFTLKANGAIKNIRLVKRSGSRSVDRAAMDLLKRASPFPPIPTSLGTMDFVVRAPIRLPRR